MTAALSGCRPSSRQPLDIACAALYHRTCGFRSVAKEDGGLGRTYDDRHGGRFSSVRADGSLASTDLDLQYPAGTYDSIARRARPNAGSGRLGCCVGLRCTPGCNGGRPGFSGTPVASPACEAAGAASLAGRRAPTGRARPATDRGFLPLARRNASPDDPLQGSRRPVHVRERPLLR